MKLLAILTAAAAIFSAAAGSANASVTWTFIVTSCNIPGGGPPCPPMTFGSPTPQPGTSLATMIIDQPTASGTASWDGSYYVPLPIPPAVITGDPNFAFTFDGLIGISPPNYNQISGCLGGPCFYNLIWSETPASLSLEINAQGDDTVELDNFTSTGGGYYNFVGCFAECDIRGFWQSNLVPEPMSASLLVSALVGLAVVRRSRLGVSATSFPIRDSKNGGMAEREGFEPSVPR